MSTALAMAKSKRGVVIDVGAATAIQTKMAYQDGRKVYSLECLSSEHGKLQPVLFPLQPNVTLIHACAGANVELAKLYLAQDSSSLIPDSVFKTVGGVRKSGESQNKDQRTYEDVLIVQLDMVIPRDEPVALIKVDVQGAEYAVFQGAKHIIARDKPVVMYEDSPSMPHTGNIQADLLHAYECPYYRGEDWICVPKAP